jgi:hypothetical protein
VVAGKVEVLSGLAPAGFDLGEGITEGLVGVCEEGVDIRVGDAAVGVV